MGEAHPGLDRAACRFAEIMVEFQAIEESAADRLPSAPDRRDFDAIHPAVRIEMAVFHRRAEEAERKRARTETVPRTCPGCWEDFEVELHAHPGRTREYCTDACKQKAYRTRRTTAKERTAAAV